MQPIRATTTPPARTIGAGRPTKKFPFHVPPRSHAPRTINQLKAGEGKDIAVAGSPGLIASLLDQNLLDQVVLLVHPVIAGGGRKRMFAADTALKKLELVSAKPPTSGVVITTYRPLR